MANHKHNPRLIIIPWRFLILTVVVYLGIFFSIGADIITIGVLTVLWYPYLSYYLTFVSFYNDYMTIRRPLFLFYSKDIRYANIDSMKLTEGKGTMIKIFISNKKNAYTFSPPLLKKKMKDLLVLLETMGLEYHN